MNRTIIMCAALAAVIAAGTGCHKYVKTPADFAKMKEPGWNYEYRAISSDEVVLGVQKKPNEPKGDVGFWTQVWKEKFPPIKDYVHVLSEDLETDAGLEGSLIELTSEEDDGIYRLFVGLFVVKKNIWILSAGGKDENVITHREEIITAFKSFKP